MIPNLEQILLMYSGFGTVTPEQIKLQDSQILILREYYCSPEYCTPES